MTKVQASKFADLLAELQEEREKLREQQDLEGDPILLVTMLSSCSGDCRLLLVEDHMPSFLGHRLRWGSLPTTSGEGCLDLQHIIFHCQRLCGDDWVHPNSVFVALGSLSSIYDSRNIPPARPSCSPALACRACALAA